MNLEQWVLCPFCKSKTRLKIRDDTVLKNFPLFVLNAGMKHL